MKILIIEDDAASRAALRELLRGEGHEAVAKARGREAVEACAKLAPDLLIVDYRLPDMSGLEVLATIAKSNGARRPPAFLITAYTLGPRARSAARALGARVFSKPVSPRELLALVRAAGARGREVLSAG